jgi:hypothetical protein
MLLDKNRGICPPLLSRLGLPVNDVSMRCIYVDTLFSQCNSNFSIELLLVGWRMRFCAEKRLCLPVIHDDKVLLARTLHSSKFGKRSDRSKTSKKAHRRLSR